MNSSPVALCLAAALLPQQDRAKVPSPASVAEQRQVLAPVIDFELGRLGDQLLLHAEFMPPVAQYALLTEVRRLGHRAESLRPALLATYALAKHFDVDTIELLTDTLERFSRASPIPDVVALAWLDVCDRAIASDRLDAAKRCVRFATHDSLRPTFAERRESIQKLATARAKLRDDLDQYRVLWQGRLDAVGQDIEGPLAELVKLDRSGKDDPSQSIAAGDAWVAAAEAHEEPLVRTNLRRYALRCYSRAFDSIGDDKLPLIRKAIRVLVRLLPDQGPGAVRFHGPEDLEQFSLQGGSWRIEGRRLYGKSEDDHALATYRWTYSRIECVRFRGRISSDNGHNFRFTVGPIQAILNWECADENHFSKPRTGEKVVTKGHLLTKHTDHEILVFQLGSSVLVTVDGKLAYSTRDTLEGPVSVYPAFSEIAVRDVTILGKIDVAEGAYASKPLSLRRLR